jgi:hypothetical protein
MNVSINSAMAVGAHARKPTSKYVIFLFTTFKLQLPAKIYGFLLAVFDIVLVICLFSCIELKLYGAIALPVLLKINEPINPLAVNVSSASLGLGYVPCPNDMLANINCDTAARAMVIADTVD